MAKTQASIIREANKVILVERNLDAVDKYFSTDYRVNITKKSMKGGHELVKDIVGSLLQSFSRIQLKVDILVESGQRVAWQRTLRATHSKAFKGFPATGLQITWRDMITSEFREGLIAEEWVLTDLAEQLLLSRKRKSAGKTL